MVIDLGNRAAVPAKAFTADTVGLLHRLVNLRFLFFHPREQCRTKVKTDAGIIIG